MKQTQEMNNTVRILVRIEYIYLYIHTDEQARVKARYFNFFPKRGQFLNQKKIHTRETVQNTLQESQFLQLTQQTSKVTLTANHIC